MRHETCLACKYIEDFTTGGADLATLTIIGEHVSPDMHHHHANTCKTCGRWWFDDVKLGAFGQPYAVRRDTELCGCPDTPTGYNAGVIVVPGVPEAECSCTAEWVNEHQVPINIGGTG